MSALDQTDNRINSVQSPIQSNGAPASVNAQLDIWNTSAGATFVMTYQFETAQPADLSSVFSGWTATTAAEQAAIRSVLDEYESVANVRFVRDDAAADPDINFGKVSLPNGTGGIGGWNFTVGWDGNGNITTRTIDSHAVFNNTFDISTAGNRNLLLHEFGHAMTLKHPGAYDVGGNIPPGPYLPAAEDNNKYTVMSYNSNPDNGANSDHLMLYDIAALQARWGANMSYHTGNDVYTGPNGNIQCIWDAGGNDTIDASARAQAVTIDLHDGSFSSLGALNNLSIAFGVVIEKAIGGSGSDTIVGNQAGNSLIGNGGADAVYGYEGADYLRGDAGADSLYGGDGDDYIYGGTENDLIYGDSSDVTGSGNDTLYGEGGNDTVVAGEGNDYVDGGIGDDSIYGNNGADVLAGWDGNDYINGGFGTDQLFGNSGNDVLDGADADDLMFGGDGSDAMYGGSGNDQMLGENDNDVMQGQAGNDYLQGGAGNDTLFGGAGSDTFDGGAGNDYLVAGDAAGVADGAADAFYFRGNWGVDTISGFGDVPGDQDILYFEAATVGSFANVYNNMNQQGANVLLAIDANHGLWILNTTKAALYDDIALF